MLGKLLPLVFIICIFLPGVLWSSCVSLTTMQPGWLQDPINKAWGKMSQCCPALPSCIQPCFCCSSRFSSCCNFHDRSWDLSLSASREEKVPSLSLLPQVHGEGTFSTSLGALFQGWQRGCSSPKKSFSGLRPTSPCRLGCHSSLCLGSADFNWARQAVLRQKKKMMSKG